MTKHPFDALPLPEGGALLFTPCPGTKEADLASSLAQLKEAGAEAVVTVMPDAEMAGAGAQDLPEVCRQNGMRWFHFPIEDDAAPAEDFQAAWGAGRDDLLKLLAGGATVAVHCKGGSGRTGLMVAIVLLERGVPFADAIAEVKRMRPKALQIPAHVAYLAGRYSG
jgi:protein-tyrosine phosphatase